MIPIEQQINKKHWLSPTSINAYLKCPRKFFYSKIAKLKQKPNIHLLKGIAVHNTIEKFYSDKYYLNGDMYFSDFLDTVLNLFNTEWDSLNQAMIKIGLKSDEIEFYKQDCKKMVINFIHQFIKEKGYKNDPPIVEKTLFSKKNKVMGRMDAIFEQCSPPLIIDYKTCKSCELTDDYKRQLGIYALLYKEQNNVMPTLGIHFLKFKKGYKTYDFSDEDLQIVEDLIEMVHQETESDDIADYPCECGWCDKNFGQ